MLDRWPLIEARGLAVGYRGGPPVLQDVTFVVAAGERIGVLGPNGGGKTTLMRALLGELQPRSGTLDVRFARQRDADVVLFDEPFTGLDAPSADRLTALIDALAAEGRCVLVTTHDLGQVRAWDHVLCLNRRQIDFGPPEHALTEEVLAATYEHALVRAAIHA